MRSTLFIFVFLAASESVSGILDNVEERFVASIAKAFKCSRVAVVLRLRGGEKASTVDFGSVMLGYDKDDPASIGETVEAIVDLVESESADMVYFAASAGHRELARHLAKSTGVFRSRTASIFLPGGDFKDIIDERELGLRLDSKVYFYDLFDNGTGADIEERYYIKSKARVRRTVGRWTGGSKVSLDVQFNIWERRADLKGVELVNAVMPLSILTIVDCDSSKPLRVSGYLIDLFALIQERLNFTASHVCPKDREWGSRLGDNGTWSGIISMLATGLADVSLAGLTWNSGRDTAVDFSVPVMEELITVLVPNRGHHFDGNGHRQWLVYVLIFPASIWFCCLAIVAVIAVGFRAIGFFSVGSSGTTPVVGTAASVAAASRLFLQRESGINLNSSSARILLLSGSTCFYLIFAYYTGDMVAVMTSAPTPPSVSSFDDVIESGYRVLALAGSSAATVLEQADSDSSMGMYYETNMMDDVHAMISTSEEIVETMLSDTKTVAYLSELEVLGDHRFDVMDDSPDLRRMHIACAYQKDSEFTQLFDYHLRKAFESGVPAAIEHRWTAARNAKYGLTEPASLGLESTMFPFLVLAGCAAVALLLLIIESVRERL